MLLKSVRREVIENGEAIGVVDAINDHVEEWLTSINRIANLNLDWQYATYENRKLPHIYFAGSPSERGKAISRLERYAYRLVEGRLIAVKCDFSDSWRPAMTPEQAQLDLGTDEEACDHSLWMGVEFSGWHCPTCGKFMVDICC